MDTQTYTPQSWINIREAIENATRMARATGRTIIVQMNGVKFDVNKDSNMQMTIDKYMKMLNEKKQQQR